VTCAGDIEASDASPVDELKLTRDDDRLMSTKRVPTAAEPRRMGRPTTLTADVSTRILNAVRAGVALHRAAAFAGIHDETLRKWRRDGERARGKLVKSRSREEQRLVEFIGALDQALASAAVRFQTVVYEVATDHDVDASTRLRAATWYLSHREVDDYNEQVRVTGKDGGPIEHELSGDAAFAALLQLQGLQKTEEK
jgi:transposase-like protein